jgi:uncharacterized protein involved in outer membrane biogenesis
MSDQEQNHQDNDAADEESQEDLVKKKKKAGYLFPLFLVLFCVLTLAIGISLLSMGNLGKSVVEKASSATLGVPVTMSELKANPRDLEFEIIDLVIGNPQGYQNPNAIEVKSIEVSGESFTQGKLIIDTIEVEGATVYFEVKSSGTNLTDLKNGVNRHASKPPEQADAEVSPTVVSVNKVIFNNTNIKPSSELIDKELVSVSLTGLKIEDIGTLQGGVLPSQAISEVINYLIVSSIKKSAKAGHLKGLKKDAINDIKSSLKR